MRIAVRAIAALGSDEAAPLRIRPATRSADDAMRTRRRTGRSQRALGMLCPRCRTRRGNETARRMR